jgi:CRISPR-associated protein Cst2
MFLNIAYITKVNIASLNGSEGTGGNLTVMKKISNYNGDEFAYVSGQALRRYLKETLMQLQQNISSVDKDGNPTFKEGNEYINLNKALNEELKNKVFKHVCDLDLFGYMFPQGDRRWSPVKVSPLVSLLPYKGEYDYLTRKKKVEAEDAKSGNIVQIEIDTLNFMRGNIIINLSHIGCDIDEYTYESKKILEDKDKNQRINVLLDAIKNFNGGAKQARNLEDISPKFVVVTRQKTGNPFLLNVVSVDKNGNINIDQIKDAIDDSDIEDYTVGIAKGIFPNENEVIEKFNATSIKEAINKYKFEENNESN